MKCDERKTNTVKTHNTDRRRRGTNWKWSNGVHRAPLGKSTPAAPPRYYTSTYRTTTDWMEPGQYSLSVDTNTEHENKCKLIARVNHVTSRYSDQKFMFHWEILEIIRHYL